MKEFFSTFSNFLGVPVCLRHTILNGCFQDVANAQDKNIVRKFLLRKLQRKKQVFLLSQSYLFVGLFSFRVILHFVFKWVYAFNTNIFIVKFYISLFFYIQILFSLTATYDIPFLQIHTTIYFLLVSCYIINVNQR